MVKQGMDVSKSKKNVMEYYDKEIVTELVQGGMPIYKIALKLGYKISTLTKYIKINNIKRGW